MLFTFVILHYKVSQDTIECVESIQKNIGYKNYKIVIVENGSGNDSIGKVKKKLENMENIYFIESQENLGFAKGNNLGFIFAKENLNSDFIVCINSDTIINQNDFIEKILSNFDNYKFTVMGPDILTLDNQHQNPMNTNAFSKKQVKEIINKCERIATMNDSDLEIEIEKNEKKQIMKRRLRRLGVEKFVRKLVNIFSNKYSKIPNTTEFHENVQLHGAALVFSPLYIEKYDGFFDKTFMYMEEDILFYLSRKNKFKMLYAPNVKIIHKEGSATKYETKTNINRERFIHGHRLNSAIEFLKLMENE